MHKLYSEPVKSFDREVLLHQLEPKKVFHAFQRVLPHGEDGMLIRGIPDDYRILLNPKTQEKYLSVIEVKTTNHDSLWANEEAAAIFQLQLYLWLMRPIFEFYNYKIWKRHYLEIYSQHSGKLMKRIPVVENQNIINELRYIINALLGLEKIQPLEFYVCKRCPKTTKENCDWYKMRSGARGDAN